LAKEKHKFTDDKLFLSFILTCYMKDLRGTINEWRRRQRGDTRENQVPDLDNYTAPGSGTPAGTEQEFIEEGR
jgi:hypothetical protein